LINEDKKDMFLAGYQMPKIETKEYITTDLPPHLAESIMLAKFLILSFLSLFIVQILSILPPLVIYRMSLFFLLFHLIRRVA
jgi:hypothetical protein